MAEPSPLPTTAPAAEPSPTPAPITNGTPTPALQAEDVEMKDGDLHPAQTPTQPTTPAVPAAQSSLPTPTPAPAPTPTRNSPHPSAPQMPPTHANPHGSPTRVYLNQNVTPHLLEAMKHLVTNEPEKPLKWLSEFLAQKSLEIEGS